MYIYVFLWLSFGFPLVLLYFMQDRESYRAIWVLMDPNGLKLAQMSPMGPNGFRLQVPIHKQLTRQIGSKRYLRFQILEYVFQLRNHLLYQQPKLSLVFFRFATRKTLARSPNGEPLSV